MIQSADQGRKRASPVCVCELQVQFVPCPVGHGPAWNAALELLNSVLDNMTAAEHGEGYYFCWPVPDHADNQVGNR